jgi:ABC-2 type transport system permease protein
MPATVLLIVGLAFGVHFPGIDGLLITIVLAALFAAVAASYAVTIALRFKTQAAAPLMQAGMFILILTTTAYAPLPLLTGWLHTVAEINPVTRIVDAARQGFVGGVSWAGTWPGLVALADLVAVLGALSLRQMYRVTDE